MLVELIKNMDGWFFFPNLQVRRHLAETGKTKIYGKRDEARFAVLKAEETLDKTTKTNDGN